MKKIGIGVLAVGFLSNCFLTGYLNEGLKPYNTVTGAQAKLTIQAAAGSAWTTALQLYGGSRNGATFERITAGYKDTGKPDIGDVYEQRALAGVIAAASKTIVDGENYTVKSVNDCVNAISHSMIAFGQGRIDEADKSAENCMNNAEEKLWRRGTYNLAPGNGTDTGDITAVLQYMCWNAGGVNNFTDAGCFLGAVLPLNQRKGVNILLNPGGVGTSNTGVDVLAGHLTGLRMVDFMQTTFDADATKNIETRNKLMDMVMAIFIGRLASDKCGSKFGEERLHEALSTTAFMGAQQCELKKAGSIVQTDFLSL